MRDPDAILDAIDRTGLNTGSPPKPHVALTEENLEKILADPNEDIPAQQRRSLTNRLENLRLEREQKEANAARPMRDVISEIRR